MKLKKGHISNLMIFLLSLTFSLMVGEYAARAFYKHELSIHEDERNLTYRHDSDLGWFPIENSKKSYTGSRTISVRHNSRGFRDPEHIVDDRPGIVFIGDSFLWGYDVEESERFTDLLRTKLPEWSIYNLGVSGYGTDQEYLLLKMHYDFYKPDIVFLVFCADNDEVDNSWNKRYEGYYKPYFVANGNNLLLRGVPVPVSGNHFFVKHNLLSKSYLFRWIANLYFKHTDPPGVEVENPTHAIITNMHEFVNNRGARFIVGLQGRQSSRLEGFLTNHEIPFVRLANNYRYSTFGNHWTPEGNTVVSNRIHGFLKEGNYLQRRTVPENALNTNN